MAIRKIVELDKDDILRKHARKVDKFDRRLGILLDDMAETMRADPVTERKTQEDSTVSLFKLRDLTAAYKELTGDLALEGGEAETLRVIVDP